MQERGELAADADPDALTLGLLAAVQGGVAYEVPTNDQSPAALAGGRASDLHFFCSGGRI